MKKLTTLITLLLCAVTLFAQAPEKFTYQAVVRNASNSLVANTQVGMRVSILQGSANGSAVYVETQTGTTNANGLVTLSIGGGNVQQGTFANIDWGNGPFYLKTETDPNGGSNYTVTTTQQLLSVPYALYAKTAENGFSGDYNDLTNTPQNVSVFNNDAEYITNAQLMALLAALNSRIDSLQTLLNIVAPGVDVMSCPEAPTVTDVDGNVYQTVKIGNQCWMRENLRTTHYADGSSLIPGSSADSDYPYYYTYSGSTIPFLNRGYLYNWTAVRGGAASSNAVPSGVQGVCPTGWHLPSLAEFTVLINYVSSQSGYWCDNDSENIAKALAITAWWNSTSAGCSPGNDPGTNNLTGFGAVPAGCYWLGGYSYAGEDAHFWTSTGINNTTDAFDFEIENDDWEVRTTDRNIRNGYSVRCVRN